MKLKLAAIGLLIGTLNSAQAAVTLSFSDGTTNYLTNFANGAGVSVATDGSNRMVWGVIVDGGSDGFNGANSSIFYQSGFSLAANNTGILLSATTNGTDTFATNDVLYIASAVMASSATASDGASANMNRVMTISGLVYSGNVAAGKAYAIVWFDRTALGGTAGQGLKYGVMPTGLVLPADPGTSSLGPNFAGADPLKTLDFTVGAIPEPSAALLGAVGALGLLRRRR